MASPIVISTADCKNQLAANWTSSGRRVKQCQLCRKPVHRAGLYFLLRRLIEFAYFVDLFARDAFVGEQVRHERSRPAAEHALEPDPAWRFA